MICSEVFNALNKHLSYAWMSGKWKERKEKEILKFSERRNCGEEKILKF